MTEAGYDRPAATTAGQGYYAPAGMLGRLDWGAIVASVVAGIGITILLVTIGAAIGIEAADDTDDNAGRIAAGVGTWTVISALLGTLIGTFIGGRFSRWQSPGSATYHGITSWGVTTLLGAWLGASGALGLLGAALGREDVGPQQAQQAEQGAPAEAAQQAADAISWGGWALALGMLLTLLAAIIGWWLGSRTRLADAESDTPGDRGTTRGDGGGGRPNTLTGT
jgi:MFS family permease